MRLNRKKLTPGDVNICTDWASGTLADVLQRAERCATDSDAAKRQAARECRACFYLFARIGCSKVSKRQCGVCNNIITAGNSCVNVVCNECADRLRLCARCGADRELKERRSKKWEFVATDTLTDDD